MAGIFNAMIKMCELLIQNKNYSFISYTKEFLIQLQHNKVSNYQTLLLDF